MPYRHFLLGVKQWGAGEDLLKIYHLKRRSPRSRIRKQVCHRGWCSWMHVCAFISVGIWIFCLTVCFGGSLAIVPFRFQPHKYTSWQGRDQITMHVLSCFMHSDKEAFTGRQTKIKVSGLQGRQAESTKEPRVSVQWCISQFIMWLQR